MQLGLDGVFAGGHFARLDNATQGQAMVSAIVNAEGQVSIPPTIVRSLGIEPGDRVEFVLVEPGKVLLLAASRSVTELKGMFGECPKSISIDEMNCAIVARGTAAR